MPNREYTYKTNSPINMLELPSPDSGITEYSPTVTPVDPAEELKMKRSRQEQVRDLAIFTEPPKKLAIGTVQKYADKLSENILESVMDGIGEESENDQSEVKEPGDPDLVYNVEGSNFNYTEAPPPQYRKKKKRKLFPFKPATIREDSQENSDMQGKQLTTLSQKSKTNISLKNIPTPVKGGSHPERSSIHIMTPMAHLTQSRLSVTSRGQSRALSRRSIGYVRYQMFGTMMLSTPDFFNEPEVRRTGNYHNHRIMELAL